MFSVVRGQHLGVFPPAALAELPGKSFPDLGLTIEWARTCLPLARGRYFHIPPRIIAARVHLMAAMRSILSLFWVLGLGFNLGAASVRDTAKTKVDLLLGQGVASPGMAVLAGLRLTTEPGWHTYWRNPGESGSPTTVQWTIVESGSYIRKHFFGKYPELAARVVHLSDEQLRKMQRGGHDPRKVYAAFKAAVEHKGQPTVILAKTVKGYGLGEAGEGRNISHQQKKMNEKELREFRARFDIPISDDEIADMPFFKPADDSPEIKYLLDRREKLAPILRLFASAVPREYTCCPPPSRRRYYRQRPSGQQAICRSSLRGARPRPAWEP